jgi:hypothetical protein
VGGAYYYFVAGTGRVISVEQDSVRLDGRVSDHGLGATIRVPRHRSLPGYSHAGVDFRYAPRPVWVCVWGGPREVAQAIWRVQTTRSPADLEQFLSKLRIYLIGKQDGSAQWLLDNFPSLFVILSEKNYMGMFWNMRGADPKLADLPWINANIRQGHGPLGATYPQSGFNPKSPGQQEGDTPSFLYLVSAVRGLNDPEKPDQDSWGGKFTRRDRSRNHWFDDPTGTQTVSRWRAEVQQDFARRADWMKDP